MLQPMHHSKRRYWEIGLAAPSLEFKANDGPSKEGRDEECDMCLIFPSSTFSTCRVRTRFAVLENLLPRRSELYFDYCVNICASVCRNLIEQLDDNRLWLINLLTVKFTN
ncbi:Protein of unknown function [Cotesia congregata]|uniref:Uncharacterized protein n=1 Tax=Cotesia congregata TaxID=51543 RepID=A0A8J2HIJ2_COTCN|nr:Protein of unknown function [Cotesia congregata]